MDSSAASPLPAPSCDNSVTDDITDDSFAYLERNSFSSEKFKIEIRGLPKFYGIGELKKLLNNKLKLKSSKIKPPKRGSEWLYVCFRSEEDRREAIAKLSGYVWKNRKLSAQPASAVRDPLVLKRNETRHQTRSEIISEQNCQKDLSSDELLKFSTVPLWNEPYDRQLQIKMDKMRSVLTNLGKNLLFANKFSPRVRKLLENRMALHEGLPCELSDIRHASSDSYVNGYRNKCEFTIGLNEETKEKTVGFRFGSYVEGTISVGSVEDMPHVTTSMKIVVQKFENFIRSSELNVYNPETHHGFWKQLTVRVGIRTNEIMTIIGVNTHEINFEKLETIKTDVKQFFTFGDGKSCGITSLYLQTADFMLNQKFSKDSLHLLNGSPTIREILCGLTFHISPLSFFQPNTIAAEILYNSVGELMSLSPEVTVLDICCGTGAIGMCLAKSGAQILGIESEDTAIENAKHNCEQNNVGNCTFYHGRAEEILSAVISKAKNSDIVAIVDPPRAGLHQKTVLQLRKTNNINNLIYLSCNPEAASKNFVTLGKPPSKTLFGSQFLPVRAVPVDNFPYTNHCELVVYFERFENHNKNETDSV